MNLKTDHIILAIAILLFSCDKEEEQDPTPSPAEPKVVSVSGKVQKGPFKTGTEINIYELNSSFGQTGQTFLSSTNSNAGDFSLNNIELESDLVLLSAEGYFFNELTGYNSDGQLNLQAYADLSSEGEVNINVLTHVIRGRIENLVNEGLSYEEAYAQARDEMYAFLGVENSNGVAFEEMDISEDSEEDAILLAFSCMVQTYAGIHPQVADISQFLTELKLDFADDGTINQSENVEQLIYNNSLIDVESVVENLSERYDELGVDASVSDFTPYLETFVLANDSLYDDFYYPQFSSVGGGAGPSNSPNLLDKNKTQYYDGGNGNVITAHVPFGEELRIKIIQQGLSIWFVPEPLVFGWEISESQENGWSVITLTSTRHNVQLGAIIGSWGMISENSSAIIEYYEDGTDIPTFSKTISVSY